MQKVNNYYHIANEPMNNGIEEIVSPIDVEEKSCARSDSKAG